MSNIGKQPISLPDSVKISISGNLVEVKGQLGELTLNYDSRIDILSKDDSVVVTRKSNDRKDKELHGLYRALIQNMVTGVSIGFEKKLLLVGVGYTAEKKGDLLLINVGFSHPIYFQIPEGLNVTTPDQTTIVIKGHHKQNVGDFTAKIRSMRKPEPYKGKGIKYSDEVVRRKAGKVVGGAS
ncbi:MAG: 50S ribosomal protein L6 [Candidatus Marinimicrobia bacterium]|nr:50S ribosomal protein L6 [Candidatus Neomarinimicrobiota bacterium]|tara:strand:+ start:22665 stop:23210 length:546 start_codon:yes stop_codon:yes gene_type:complete